MGYPEDYDLADLQAQWNWIVGRLAHIERTSPIFAMTYTSVARMPISLMCSVLDVRQKVSAIETVLDTFPQDLPSSIDDGPVPQFPACVFQRPSQGYEDTRNILLEYHAGLEKILTEHVSEVRVFCKDLEQKARDLRLSVAAALTQCLLERTTQEQSGTEPQAQIFSTAYTDIHTPQAPLQRKPSQYTETTIVDDGYPQLPSQPDTAIMRALADVGHSSARSIPILHDFYEPITPSESPCPIVSPTNRSRLGLRRDGKIIRTPSSPVKLFQRLG